MASATVTVPVTVTVDEQPHELRTAAATVGDLLNQQGVSWDRHDDVSPAPATVVANDTHVTVEHRQSWTEVVRKPIAPRTVKRWAFTLPVGQTKLVDAGNPGVLMTPENELANLAILLHQLGVSLVRVPTSVPGLDHAEAKPVWVDLLTHVLLSSLLDHRRDVRAAPQSRRHAAVRPRFEALQRRPLVHKNAADVQFVYVELVVVLRVRRSRFNHLEDVPRGRLRHELKHRQGFVHRPTPHRVNHEPHLLRRATDALGDSSNFHDHLLAHRTGALTLDMPAEMPGGGKLAKLVPDHVLANEDGHMTATVVHGNGQADHVRNNGRVSRPGLYDALLSSAGRGRHLLCQRWLDVGSLLYRS